MLLPTPLRIRSGTAAAIAVLGVALVAWVVTVGRMSGMDAGPGTSLGGLGWYLAVWVTMMAAMMLPSAVPVVSLFARISDGRTRGSASRVVRPACFVAGYLVAWGAFGLAAYGADRLVEHVGGDVLTRDRAGPYVAGGAIVAAGLYQLSPLKRACLRHCRGPLQFFVHSWRPDRLGAIALGVEHGGYCVGCCWGLMLALFAVGVMSLFWMVVLALVIFAEKVLPVGERISQGGALGLVALGIWIAVAPGSVPHVTSPSTPSRAAMP